MPNQSDIRKLAQLLDPNSAVRPGEMRGGPSAPAPFSPEEDAQYGYPGQGDAYDNPDNPNYWLNNMEEAYPYVDQGPATYHPPAGMEQVFQPDSYPALDVLGQPGQQEQDDQDYWDTDMGMQELYGVDPYGNPLPGMQQYPPPETDMDYEELDRRKQAIRSRGPLTGAIDEPDAAYQPGRSAFMAGPGAANDAIRKISEAVMLSQQRPIWGTDLLGPQTGGEMDAVSYQATPYERGRQMPPEMAGQMEGGDQELQDLTGLDPYGNPLPPSWAQRVPKR